MALRGNLFLLLAAFFWGTTFVAQSVAMDGMGPYLYNAARYLVGTIVVFLIFLVMRRAKRDAAAGDADAETTDGKSGFRYGLGAGCIMLIATTLQQVGLQYTTVGKAAFITCLYIIFVPLAARLFGRPGAAASYVGALVALSGLYLLSIPVGDFELVYGDVLLFASALFWTLHILFIAHFAPTADAVEISLSQLAVCMIGSTVLALLFETVTFAAVAGGIIPILYAGVMSSGLGFTLQILGQKTAPPAAAAVIMSLEAVFGAASGALLLDEVMTARELSGCGLMLTGMILTQVSTIKRSGRDKRKGLK
ncbi:DMT family transporter [Selenomonas sp. TAMA-11512]|uniref:DMT family transporter n=1 Tax=Selenomonas sp. TAMA-11512 TaxID=3095337 RepID=UPI00308FB1AD|nr:DMT family transporter [Selenomonas sp. TAMA-11512]